MEQHSDDLGDCLDSILPDVDCTAWTEALLESGKQPSLDGVPFCALLELYSYMVDFNVRNFESGFPTHCVDSSEVAREVPSGSHVHIIELFGGEGRIYHMLSRFLGAKPGSNHELTQTFDLLESRDVRMMLHYITDTKPLIVVMSPHGSSLVPTSQLTKVVNPKTSGDGRRQASQLARVFARAAEIQVTSNRHYLIEQPTGSDFLSAREWAEIACKYPTCKVTFDQCAVGLRTPTFPHHPMCKPTEMWASHHFLISRLQGKQCLHMHRSLSMPHYSERLHFPPKHSLARIWPRKLCEMITVGIADLATGVYVSMYPSANEATSSADTSQLECPGCRWHKRKDDPVHTRVGDCRYPHVEPKCWDCKGCVNGRPRTHVEHTLDDTCQWATSRVMPEGAVRERTGQHPRDPRVAAAREPTAAARIGGNEASEPSRSSRDRSSGSAPARRDAASQVVAGGAGPSAAPASAPAPAAAAAAPLPRARGSLEVEASDGGVAVQADMPEDDGGWSRFDLGHALQMLRSVREAIVRRTLRKLHIRWYHCSSAKMKALLAAAGVDAKVLALIPQIVDTCTVCRAWARPGPSAAVSTRLPIGFNEEIQIDLLFIERKTILHMIDVCTRFTVAHVIPTKETDDILSALQKFWIGLYGPPSKIVADQEGGWSSPDAAAWLSAREIELIPKAKYAHANVVERHQEILRRQVHLLKDQTLSDGVRISFDLILAESVFAKNALFRVGNMTPYQALYGRVPPLYDVLTAESGQSVSDANADVLRSRAIQAMIQATAEAKLLRAGRTKTRPSGELLELAVGDQVDIFRKGTTKDISGWLGPCVVCDLTQLSEGQVNVKFQGKVLLCRVQDIRRSLMFSVFLSKEPANSPVSVIRDAAESHDRMTIRLGWFQQNGKWHALEANSKYPRELIAGLHLAACNLHFNGVVSMRFGCNVNSLAGVVCDESLLVWWVQHKQNEWFHAFIPGTQSVNFERLCSREPSGIAFVQFFAADQESVATLRVTVNDIPNVGGIHEPSLPPLRDVTEQVEQRRLLRQLEDGVPVNAPEEYDIGTPSDEQSESAQQPHDASSSDLDFPLYASSPPEVCTNAAPEAIFLYERDEFYLEPPQLAFDATSANFLATFDCKLQKDEMIVFNYESVPTAVIERVNNIITRSEALANVDRCREAMTKELLRWHKHGAWRRGPRSHATNPLTSKWVLKWKDMAGTRGVKARLVAQGFKDVQTVENYSPTTSRWGQRLLTILAVQFNWKVASADVSEAFLRGLTFNELHETGHDKVLREVQLILPPGSLELIRTLPGLSDFDPNTEVLHLLKPGFGLKDAPRLWNLALQKVLKKLGLVATQADPQFFIKHEGGQLVLAMTTHVDDLKITGKPSEMAKVIKGLEEAFDTLKLDYDNFEHLGLRHTLNEDMSRSISQNHYVAELKPIPDAAVRLMNPEQVVDDTVRSQFQSLLGGVAWVAQTRPDAAVFISALQRKLKEPKAKDILNLNRVLKYLKLKPMSLTFKRVEKPWRLVAISDSGFKGEDQDCLAVRSGIIGLIDKDGPFQGRNTLQILEFVSKKQTKVCRSTFAAELHSALDLSGLSLTINSVMTEVLQGPTSAANLLQKQESMSHALQISLVIDALSVYSAAAGEETQCTDQTMLLHLLSLRQLLRTSIQRLVWCDTRYLVCDGLNKGIIDRQPLRLLAEQGLWLIGAELKQHCVTNR